MSATTDGLAVQIARFELPELVFQYKQGEQNQSNRPGLFLEDAETAVKRGERVVEHIGWLSASLSLGYIGVVY